MPAKPHNPYAPPTGEPPKSGIAISGPLKQSGIALMILVSVQSLNGVATAMVVMNEGVASHSFVAGMALFTMILCALTAYAGAARRQDLMTRSVWAVLVTGIAWGVWLSSVWCAEYMTLSHPAVSCADLIQFALMACMTFIFTMLFLNRTLPQGVSGARRHSEG